ncbi:MAG TPA: mannose-1-phosphate guanylyltransferase [Tenuifilaceae bacterium]|nr:mannose-1-phosphate guanylyltransferase [Tenuifilaceae bacterium]HQB77109.1 mannose-1-phosphate guanylyltransferase [Tenuifilaceae bacterium]
MIERKNVYCVIMAGGIGSRFWPLSRNNRPKQFLDILGTGQSLIQQTFARMTRICPAENILVVTSSIYKDQVREHLPQISDSQILLEPMRRNTAPCIAFANYKIKQKNPNAVVIVAPSDHLIMNEDEFVQVIDSGVTFANEHDALLTLGIKPDRPETGYGYIQACKKSESGIKNLYKVKTFTEKPNHELAKVFFESGEFFWNSGIFIWSLKSIISSFEAHLPEVNNLFAEASKSFGSETEGSTIETVYSECRNISIDYGVMEKANNVFVICSDFGWSDLGTWGSLYAHSKKDLAGNCVAGNNVLTYNLKNTLVNVPKDKLVVLHGLEDFIVVESDNILLVCKKDDEQEIKKFVNDVLVEKGERYT